MATMKRLLPIRTFLLYFIIIAFLLIAFNFPFAKVFGKQEVQVVQQPPPSPEVKTCNGLLTETESCGIGQCTGTTTRTCIDGAWGSWSDCSGNVNSRPELCNGFDDNCDGRIDNIDNPPHCESAAGVCSGPYYRKCGGSLGWLHCQDSDYGPDFEPVEVDCTDGLDNDCDGKIDGYDDVTCNPPSND